MFCLSLKCQSRRTLVESRDRPVQVFCGSLEAPSAWHAKGHRGSESVDTGLLRKRGFNNRKLKEFSLVTKTWTLAQSPCVGR